MSCRESAPETVRSPISEVPISVSGKVNGDQIANLLKQVQVGNKDKVILAIRDMTNLTMSETRELVNGFFSEEGNFVQA